MHFFPPSFSVKGVTVNLSVWARILPPAIDLLLFLGMEIWSGGRRQWTICGARVPAAVSDANYLVFMYERQYGIVSCKVPKETIWWLLVQLAQWKDKLQQTLCLLLLVHRSLFNIRSCVFQLFLTPTSHQHWAFNPISKMAYYCYSPLACHFQTINFDPNMAEVPAVSGKIHRAIHIHILLWHGCRCGSLVCRKCAIKHICGELWASWTSGKVCAISLVLNLKLQPPEQVKAVLCHAGGGQNGAGRCVSGWRRDEWGQIRSRRGWWSRLTLTLCLFPEPPHQKHGLLGFAI